MQNDLRELVTVVLNALPQAGLIVSRCGRIILRNAQAEVLLPDGTDVETAFGGGSGGQVHWETEMAAFAENAGQLVRRNVRLFGRGSRRLLVDMHVRGIELCKGFCEGLAGRSLSACRLAAGGGGDGEATDAPGEASPAGQDNRCVLVLLQDVSAQAATGRRLAAGERLAAAGTLAAKVAHELNNPLDGVLRLVGLASACAGPEAAKHLAGARDGLMRMAAIIRGLLEQGRPWRAAGERTAVGRLLDEAVTTMQPRAHALGVAVVCDVDDAVTGTVEGAVFQVFCNVIKNALNAMPNGGLLAISLRPAGRQCEIEFLDSGHGLTEAEAERVFEPFYTTKAAGEGSGLGLTVCREIATRLGGTISLSVRPQGGAKVSIRLPLHPPWGAVREED